MINIGIVGCGDIVDIYCHNFTTHKEMNLIGVFDLDAEKMLSVQSKYPNVICYNSFEEMLEDKNIDTIANLTIPSAHFTLNKQALEANKNVYCEKPLALTYDEAKALSALANEKDLRLAAAPDTFLNYGFQAEKNKIQNNEYGKCIGGFVSLGWDGPESWHPNPEWIYGKGFGPLADLGPYYVSNLIELFGPVQSVSAHATNAKLERPYVHAITKEHKVITVETPTFVNGFMNFKNDISISFIFSYDMFGEHNLPNVQLYFENGIHNLNDPNSFTPVSYHYENGEKQFTKYEVEVEGDLRGYGVIYSRDHANYCNQKAVHSVEVVENIFTAAKNNTTVPMESTITTV